MTFILKNILKILVFLFLFSFAASAQHPAETIPDFTFFKRDETAFTSKDLEQGNLLFFVFFDAGCEHCQHAVQSLNDQYKEFKNTAIYLITADSVPSIRFFMKKYGGTLSGRKNVSILRDPNNEFMSKFKPRKYPSMYLYSPQKKLICYEDNEENMFRFFKAINAAKQSL